VVSEKMLLLARSNYQVAFLPDQSISERIIFPFSPSQSNGIEDARFVCFRDGNESSLYYATYTAYDGRTVFPQLLETSDFLHFKVCTLNGPAVQNKGMAMFPRKVGGRFCMLSRQDNENIHVMFSEHPHFWYESRIILRPAEPWEFVQLGNCGSPIETDAGWLVLTHGVGAMRKYCIGAILLDRDETLWLTSASGGGLSRVRTRIKSVHTADEMQADRFAEAGVQPLRAGHARPDPAVGDPAQRTRIAGGASPPHQMRTQACMASAPSSRSLPGGGIVRRKPLT
jgi:hypothetical protein